LRSAQGELKEGIFVFRTMDDCDGVLNYTERARRAIVIGGGVLGLEAARGLLNRGLEVHVVHVSPHLMNMQLDAAAGAILRESLERMGVQFHLEKRTVAVIGEQRISGLRFDDGTTLECEMAIISTGVRPNVEAARQAGLAVERGIVV
jgi:nitrite reductase (NADH) large subunit